MLELNKAKIQENKDKSYSILNKILKRRNLLYKRLNDEYNNIESEIFDFFINVDNNITLEKSWKNEHIYYNDINILSIYIRDWIPTEKNSIRLNQNNTNNISNIKKYLEIMKIVMNLIDNFDIDSYNERIYEKRKKYHTFIDSLEVRKYQEEYDKFTVLLNKINNDYKIAPGSIYINKNTWDLEYYYDGKERFNRRRSYLYKNYAIINAIKILKLTNKLADFKIYSDIECKNEIIENQSSKGYYRKNRKYLMTLIDQMEPDMNTQRRLKLERLLDGS